MPVCLLGHCFKFMYAFAINPLCMSALLLTGCSEIATKYQISQRVSKDHELFSF